MIINCLVAVVFARRPSQPPWLHMLPLLLQKADQFAVFVQLRQLVPVALGGGVPGTKQC